MNRGYIGDISDPRINSDYGSKYLYTIDVESFELKKSQGFYDLTDKEMNNILSGYTGLMTEAYLDIYPEEVEYFWYSNVIVVGDYKYVVGEIYENGNYYGVLLKLDSEDEIVWYKKDQKINTHYFDVTTSSNEYIAVVSYTDTVPIGYARTPDKVQTSIIIYDKDGNIYETHNVADEIGVENVDITQIATFGNEVVAQAFATDNNGTLSSYVIKYTLHYAIKTDIKDEGNIEVAEYAKNGEEVTFIVTPSEGFEIDYIKVTDNKGNTIVFTDYKFTMPSSDVIIEVKFKEKIENPNTISKSILITTLFAVTTLFVSYKSLKKTYWLK